MWHLGRFLLYIEEVQSNITITGNHGLLWSIRICKNSLWPTSNIKYPSASKWPYTTRFDVFYFFFGSNWLKQNRDTKNNPDLSCYVSQSQFQRFKQQKIIKTVATSASARLTMDTWDTGKACLIQQSLCWCVLNMYIYINMADHIHIYIYM